MKMIKGQVVAGDFGKIIVRIKSMENIELGELLVIDGESKFILQTYDLAYGSQISQQNLEMVAGMNLEEEGFSLIDQKLRNYVLAFVKPLLIAKKGGATCKRLPPFFTAVREVEKEDLSFITKPENPFYVGILRSGSKSMDFDIFLPAKKVFSHHMLISASTGKGKSNLNSCMLWDLINNSTIGVLVLDPHDEYYGRVGLGLKDHPKKDQVSYYTPTSPPPGANSLKINIKKLKPHHLAGAIILSDPQRQCLHAYYRKFKENWIESIFSDASYGQIRKEKISFHEDTLSVVQRKLLSLLNLDYKNEVLSSNGIFDLVAGENTVGNICRELEQGKIVIIDTSFFSGALEIMMGSIIAGEMFDKYKYYKRVGQLEDKPVVSFVLEEAPRVLGKKVLEQGSNIFETIAREGRKFKIGLVAITQVPSEIPKNILANMNTKIILGMEMATERQAVIESSAQDLSQDGRSIASLDKGEAIITSTFTKFAVPVKIPLFKDFSRKIREEKREVIDSCFFG